MPGLEFAICSQCAERHALWRGAMSVHTTAAGDRCAPAKAVRPQRPSPQRPAAPEPLVKLTRVQVSALNPYERAVYDLKVAEEKERARAARNRAKPLHGIRRATQPLDRAIYQVDGAYPVSGGLPTLGKRSR